jgi:hypothetical protein
MGKETNILKQLHGLAPPKRLQAEADTDLR